VWTPPIIRTQSRGGAPAGVSSPPVTLPMKTSTPSCSPCHPAPKHLFSPDSTTLELPHHRSWWTVTATHVDGSEIGHRKTNKRLHVSPYLATSQTSSRLVQLKHQCGLATMPGSTVVIPTSNAAVFHAIGSISPNSIFCPARSTTTTHETRLQSNDKQISVANLELDSTVAVAGAPSAVTRSYKFGMVATKTVAPTASTRPK
jgi:hypothetical protein